MKSFILSGPDHMDWFQITPFELFLSDCPTILPPTDVIFNSTNVPYGTDVLLHCSTGYSSIEENISIRCNEDGTWSTPLTDHCQKGNHQCPKTVIIQIWWCIMYVRIFQSI